MPLITCLNGHEIELQADQFGQRIACPLCQLLIVVSPPRAGEPLVPKYEVLCENGHVLRVKSKYLGTQIRCPQCQGLAWVTTDRLQRNIPHVVAEPIMPVVLAEPVAPRQATPMVAKVEVVPVVPALNDIPVAEVDDLPKAKSKSPSQRLDIDDEDEEDDDQELTKAERRNLKLTDQGLEYFTYSIVGYCSIQMFSAVLTFILAMIAQGISTADGARGFATFSEILGWIIFIAMVLNTMLYVGSIVLALFTPFITGATLWFIFGLILSVGFIGWRLFLCFQDGSWKSNLVMAVVTDSIFVSKVYYFISQGLFLLMWVAMMIGLWQLGKFARKPMTRQRVMLLGLLGVGCWVVIVGFPLLAEAIGPSTKAAIWVLLTFRVVLYLGASIVLIIQHLTVVNDVRAVMHRRK